MPAYDYLALDNDGRRRRGVTEADTEQLARQRLREQGLAPVELKPARAASRGAGRKLRLSEEQTVLFTRLLATLLNSGMPLDDALAGLAKHSTDANFRRVVLEVRARVLEGRSLVAGLEQFPGTFSAEYCATVGAGEQTRFLPQVLARLADFMDERRAVRQRLRLAMIYPAVLTLVSIAVVAGLLTYVVPEVVQVFEQMRRELPPLTQWLIAAGDFVRHNGLVVVGLLLLMVSGARALLRRPGPRLVFDRLLLHVPLAATMVREADAARFARTLSILLDSGLATLDALRIAAAGVGNGATRTEVESAIDRVREGAALSLALSRVRGFPPLLAHLVSSGEQSGEVARMLDSSAEAHERSVQARLAIVTGLAEPAVILLMGGVVLLIVVAILLPIFEMNQLV